MNDTGKLFALRSDREQLDTHSDRPSGAGERGFCRLQSNQGHSTTDGWAFLFIFWFMEDLLEMDLLPAGPIPGGKEKQALKFYPFLMAGYNPLSGEKWDYDADSGLILSLEGRKHKIDWEEALDKGS